MNKFKKFKIEDILKWQPQKEIDPLKINLLSVKGDKKYPFYGQATVNNGIISYLCLKDNVLNNKEGKPTILIHSNNQNIVYLETPFYLKDGHGATSVLQADFLNEKIALYLIACIKKVIIKKFCYNEKATKIALKNTIIELPVTDNDELDLCFMEEYITKLQSKNISAMKDYLIKNKLKDCTLTVEEKNAIENFESGNIVYGQFRIDELFESQNGDFDIQKKHINNKGELVISSGEQNTGIIGKSDVNAKIFEKNTITIDMFGLANFRPYEYKMVTHARVFSLKYKEKELTTEEGLYLLAQFAYFKKIFSYNNMASWTKIKDLIIELPVNSKNKIDYDFINSYIKAKEKQTLTNIVKCGIIETLE